MLSSLAAGRSAAALCRQSSNAVDCNHGLTGCVQSSVNCPTSRGQRLHPAAKAWVHMGLLKAVLHARDGDVRAAHLPSLRSQRPQHCRVWAGTAHSGADICHSAFWPQTSKTGAVPRCTLSRAVCSVVATISLCSCRAPVNVRPIHVSVSRWICDSNCVGVAVTTAPSLSSRDEPVAIWSKCSKFHVAPQSW